MQCQHHVRQLAGIVEDLGEMELVVIGPGTPEQAEAARRRNRVEIPLYADPGGFSQSSLGFQRLVLKAAQQSGIAMLDRDHAVRWYYRRTVPSMALDLAEVLSAARAVREG